MLFFLVSSFSPYVHQWHCTKEKLDDLNLLYTPADKLCNSAINLHDSHIWTLVEIQLVESTFT